MAFVEPPRESKKQINRAGHALVDESIPWSDKSWAISLADTWRACHAYPINTFQSTLRRKIKKLFGDDFIVAQRLKRMPTIIGKLKRFPHMQLSTMQDLGGVRAVLGSVDQVYILSKEYTDKSRFAHALVREDDYIKSPRSEDGYRSLHLVYRYINAENPLYDGLLVELQIRTRTQHAWATAVETMGTFLGQALKSRQGDKEWLDFFALVSSAFARIEKTPLVPRYAHMSREETFAAIKSAEKEIGALEKMRAYSRALHEIVKDHDSAKKWSYHLIILNSLEKTVEFKAYTRDEFEKAIADYAAAEAEVANGADIEPVLVSAGPLDQLRQAYPNFFLDISDFSNMVENITK